MVSFGGQLCPCAEKQTQILFFLLRSQETEVP